MLHQLVTIDTPYVANIFQKRVKQIMERLKAFKFMYPNNVELNDLIIDGEKICRAIEKHMFIKKI